MQWHTGPQTPREKWEYRKAQREWDKLRGQSGTSGAYNYPYYGAPRPHQPLVRPAFLLLLALAVAGFVFVYRDEIPVWLSTATQASAQPAANVTLPSVGSIGQTGGQGCVSVQTEAYLSAAKAVNLALQEIEANMYVDGTAYGTIPYRYYSESIADLQQKITALGQVHIATTSPLVDYESYCTQYYGKVAEFFAGLQAADTITTDDYNALIVWQQENTTPVEYLTQLFDKCQIAYTRTTTETGEQRITYTISSAGIY